MINQNEILLIGIIVVIHMKETLNVVSRVNNYK